MIQATRHSEFRWIEMKNGDTCQVRACFMDIREPVGRDGFFPTVRAQAVSFPLFYLVQISSTMKLSIITSCEKYDLVQHW